MVIKKQKKNIKQKQKQKQKQNVKVNQNVKVVVGDLKTKTKRAKKSGAGASKKQSQGQERQSISLNIINPYQQLLPPQPQAQAQAQPQAQPQAQAQAQAQIKNQPVNPRNPPDPNIIRRLNYLNDQNQAIRNDVRDLREFAQNQQQTYNYLLLAQKEQEPAESKIDKMLKNKKVMMSNMNWNKLLDNENKSEELILREEKKSPDVVKFAMPTVPVQRPIGPQPSDPRFVSTRPSARVIRQPQPLSPEQPGFFSRWFSQMKNNVDWTGIVRDTVLPGILSTLSEDSDESKGEYESKVEAIEEEQPNYPRLLSSSSAVQLIEPEYEEPQIPSSKYEELMNEPVELNQEQADEEKPMELKLSKNAKRRIRQLRKKQELKGMAEEEIQSNLMREAFKKDLEAQKNEEGAGAGAGAEKPTRGRPRGSKNKKGAGAGAGAGPAIVTPSPEAPVVIPPSRRGRPQGSRNRPREVIQEEKRAKENKKRRGRK